MTLGHSHPLHPLIEMEIKSGVTNKKRALKLFGYFTQTCFNESSEDSSCAAGNVKLLLSISNHVTDLTFPLKAAHQPLVEPLQCEMLLHWAPSLQVWPSFIISGSSDTSRAASHMMRTSEGEPSWQREEDRKDCYHVCVCVCYCPDKQWFIWKVWTTS